MELTIGLFKARAIPLRSGRLQLCHHHLQFGQRFRIEQRQRMNSRRSLQRRQQGKDLLHR